MAHRLLELFWNKNIVECRRLIDTGEANIDGDRDGNGWTALHNASCCDFLEIAELLTSSGAGVNIRERYGFTALYLVSFLGRLKIVQLLLCPGGS